MQNKNLSKGLMLGIPILIVIILAVFGFSNLINQNNNTNNTKTDNSVQVDVEKTISISVVDKDGKDNVYSVKFKGEKSVFELMKQLNKNDSSFVFEYDESAYGIYVNSFYGHKPDANIAYWEFMINGESSMVGVGDYLAKSEDEIQFKITKLEPLK